MYPVSCSYLLTSTLLVAPHPNLAWKSKAGRVFHRQPPDPSIDFWMKKRELAGKQTVTGQLQVAWSFWDPLKKKDTSKVLSLVSNFPEMQIANSYANPACQFEPWLTTREFESAALISTGTASVIRWQPYDPTRGKTRAYTCDGDHSFGEFKSREEQQRRFA